MLYQLSYSRVKGSSESQEISFLGPTLSFSAPGTRCPVTLARPAEVGLAKAWRAWDTASRKGFMAYHRAGSLNLTASLRIQSDLGSERHTELFPPARPPHATPRKVSPR